MYKIERKNYGIKFTFRGDIRKPEMEQWAKEAKAALSSLPSKFGVFVDMHDMGELQKETQDIMEKTHSAYKASGMVLSCIIPNEQEPAILFTTIEENTNIYDWETYIESNSPVGLD